MLVNFTQFGNTPRNLQAVSAARRLTAGIYGSSIYLQDGAGSTRTLWYSTDGITWSKTLVTWDDLGYILPASSINAKFIIWGKSATNSNEWMRYCADITDTAGSPFTQATGNTWSVITAGDLTLKSLAVVYG